MKILLVEDEEMLAEPVIEYLESQDYVVDWINDGAKVVLQVKVNDYDCIVLDLNLPNKNGLEISTELRESGFELPILMLTARSQIEDKIEGFDSGADDYLTKPFSFKELIARIKALIKRSKLNRNDTVEFNNLVIDLDKRLVSRDGERVELNSKEFGVLEYLIRNKDRPVSQEELLEHVWNDEIDIFTETVKTNIKTLRQKVDPKKAFIKTKRGEGYYFTLSSP